MRADFVPGRISTSPDTNRRRFLRNAVSSATALTPLVFGSRLIGALHLGTKNVLAGESKPALDDEGRMPDFDGIVAWLNSEPLSRQSLRGKVVLVNFWTYSCINSLRPLPYLKSWAAKYKDAGLVVIGVHTPEFPFEKEQANVKIALRDHRLTYPVALDSDSKVWQAFNNQYWPAFYFVDGKGRIRYHEFGEGDYVEAERALQKPLRENGVSALDETIVGVSGDGVELAPSKDQRSPETYIGYRQAERFSSPEHLTHDKSRTYSLPTRPSLNQWGLEGTWNDGARSGILQTAPGKVVFSFHSRDLHLVLGPAMDGKPVRFVVKLDGAGPGSDQGTDSAADGSGEIRDYRLYQLIRQKGSVRDRTFEIEFLDPGAQAFSFTFG